MRAEQRFQEQILFSTPKEFLIQPQEVSRKQLFARIDQANQKASKLPEYVIVLVGKTRVGKSTFHNLLVNAKVLVGKEDGANTIYVLKEDYVNNPEIAKIDNTIKSVTIMPNITFIDKNTCIIDFPGFQDRRDEIQVTQVQYIITKFLHSIKQIKFVIIFTESSLKDIANDQFRETLQHYLSLFDIKKFSLEDRVKLYKCISFCVTSVDFKKSKSYQKAKERFLTQLQVMLEKLIAFHKSNPQGIPNFQIMKQLIENIIKSKRMELFQLAEEGESPKYNGALEKMNKLGWEYLNLKLFKEKILSRFQSQFKALPEQRQNKLKALVKWRFSLGLKLRYIFGFMITDSINSTQKTINVDKYLNDLKTIIQQMLTYNQSAVLQIPPYLPADQKLRIFEQLYKLNAQIKDFKEWSDQNKLADPLQYYNSHLVFVFQEQIYLINRLFGHSQKAINLFKEIIINMNKMLQQSAIFSKLSCDFESDFKFKFKDQLTLTQEIPQLKEIKQKYIDNFLNNPIRQTQYKQDQIKRIITSIGALKQQFNTVISPNNFYKVSIKLRQSLIRIYKLNQNRQPYQANQLLLLQLEEHLYILIEAVKMHLNLITSKLTSQEQELRFVERLQNQTVKDIAIIISRYRNNQNLSMMHQQLQSAFENFKSLKDKDEAKKNVHVIPFIIGDLGKLFNIILTKDAQMPISISILASSQNREAQFTAIINQHLYFYRHEILQEKFKASIPSVHSINNQIEYSEEIVHMVKGKKAIIVLGEERCGKTLVADALKGIKVEKVQGKYVHLGNKKSRINHNAKADPFVNLIPINENQFFIEIPSIFDKVEASHRFIRMCILLSILKNLSEFSILLVERDDLLDHSFMSHINTISTLLLNQYVEIKNINLSLIVNTDKMSRHNARNIIVQNISSQTNEDTIKKIVQFLTSKQGKFFCQNICEYKNILDNYFGNVIFQTKKPSENYYNIYNKIYSTNAKIQFASKLQQKLTFLKNCSSWLIKLSLNSWLQFQQFQIYTGTKQYAELSKLLSSNFCQQFGFDQLNFDQFEPITNNRALIYANAMSIKSKGVSLYSPYAHEETYEILADYLQTYFNRIVFICCKNQQQYEIFMKLKHVFACLLKQLSFYCQLFKEKNNDHDEELGDLRDKFKLRFLVDQIDNFADFNEYVLLNRLIKEKISQPPQNRELINYIDLMVKYSKKSSGFETAISAKIELIILMGTNIEGYNLSKDIDRHKLIEQTINYLNMQKKATKRLIDSQKLIEPINQKPIKIGLTSFKKATNLSIPEQMIQELKDVRKKVVDI